MNISRFISEGDRYIEGIERYLEGIKPKTKIYDSYAQWYDDASKRKRTQQLYIHPKYYLLESPISLDATADHFSVIFQCYTGDPKENLSRKIYIKLQRESLNEVFTHRNTKLVCILHPKNPQACLELKQDEELFDEKDQICGYSWCSNQTDDIEQYCKVDPTGRYMILCVIKY